MTEEVQESYRKLILQCRSRVHRALDLTLSVSDRAFLEGVSSRLTSIYSKIDAVILTDTLQGAIADLIAHVHCALAMIDIKCKRAA